MFQSSAFLAAVIPIESTENTIIQRQKNLVNIWTTETSAKSVL